MKVAIENIKFDVDGTFSDDITEEEFFHFVLETKT